MKITETANSIVGLPTRLNVPLVIRDLGGEEAGKKWRGFNTVWYDSMVYSSLHRGVSLMSLAQVWADGERTGNRCI